VLAAVDFQNDNIKYQEMFFKKMFFRPDTMEDKYL